MADPWGVLSEEGGRVTLYEMRGDDAPRVRDFATVDAAEAGAGIAAGRLVRLGSAPDADVPAPILPTAPGAVGAVRQRAPLGVLPPTGRILIAGALADRPDREGIVCLADGGQTLWVHVSAREIVSFQGAATERLAAAFDAESDEMDQGAMDDTLARPERLAVHLNSAALEGNAAAVMGHLIGAELAAMRPYWLGQQVTVVDHTLLYTDALAGQGAQAETVDLAEAWRAGLVALGRALGLSE